MLTGKSAKGHRTALLTFIGGDLVAARWQQWRFYFKDMQKGETDAQRLDGLGSTSTSIYFPKIFNIEMDPHEDLNQIKYMWAAEPVFKVVEAYYASVKKYPNPSPVTLTNFSEK